MPVCLIDQLIAERLEIGFRHPQGRMPQSLTNNSYRLSAMESKCSPCVSGGVSNI
ncbi:hypothetical protein [Bacteroides stercoris]|uniref:hypothetical protein n=1 Tax=Bacteroides stercoris TaxID=46506 RepID=UPI0015F3157D|nr:hypothetical protein [Bacteroides stercoris]